ncbi:MATE family efflux transporter [Aliivibrio sp. 1S165]|uniref:MATE family efflux transporter n=1 Tax=unclassified Aliivibrio TaxID=2645654 RepID=UPI00080E981D|nr:MULTISPECIES: MATE family efflux transporter [unclassified Aliivibrio]OCH14834.1 MATE family efflux transporter [Aliivibrio sp. 1S165]OCH34766.1 MATE family efflux transporter [Aliivibrio sp. 1S175]
MPTPSLSKQLFQMTWPMMFGVLSLMSFQLVDSAFIGQLGILPLAAQGFTMPLQMVIIGLQVGLGIATTAVIARVLGAQQPQKAKQLGGLVIILGAVMVFTMCLVIWFSRGPILSLLGAQADVFPVIDSYWPVWLASCWTGAMIYFAYSVCRANGDTKLPGLMMVITSILNMILDPIFIFHFDLGLNGAAWATILSFSIGFCIILPSIFKRHWISFSWHDLPIAQSIKELNAVMSPAMMSQLLPPLSSMMATKIIAGFGAAAVAGWAMASRIEFFAIVVVLALTMSIPPMVGKMLGAKQFDDIQKLIRIAAKFVLTWQIGLAILLFIVAKPLANLLSTDSNVISVIQAYLMWVPISLSSLGICMLMVSVCNALGVSMRALTISILRLFACFLPMIWLGSTLFGLHGVFMGALVGNTMAGIMAWIMYNKAVHNLQKKHNR